VLRSRFETPSKEIIATWQGAGQAGAKRPRPTGGVFRSGFETLLKHFKWIMTTWPGDGKAVAKRQRSTEGFCAWWTVFRSCFETF